MCFILVSKLDIWITLLLIVRLYSCFVGRFGDVVFTSKVVFLWHAVVIVPDEEAEKDEDSDFTNYHGEGELPGKLAVVHFLRHGTP